MKRLTVFLIFFVSLSLYGQQAIIIDHSCINLSGIPSEWIETAKTDLHIGYGHTSHGSQLASGMDAVASYYTDGTYDWNHNVVPGELHLFEGSGYSSGYLELDCGYDGWVNETHEYLQDFPDCNVIIWSWCGQVNGVDLQNHYLNPMDQLEAEYPDVQFVYMTGHLEGLGPDGSLYQANQQIRDFCIANDKILFDFADIEKYDPDAMLNYQDFYADDACNYIPSGGGSANWAYDWLDANPGHDLAQISELCSSCAHSVSLNCVKKGIACWYLWARLSGWEGSSTGISCNSKDNEKAHVEIFPLPGKDQLSIIFSKDVSCKRVEILTLQGASVYSKNIVKNQVEIKLRNITLPAGVYVLRIETYSSFITKKITFCN